MQDNRERIDRITIVPQATILSALRKMDELNVKLLLILDGHKFAGLLSIGDIQRAIIRNVATSEQVHTIVRQKGVILAKPEDDIKLIKQQMFERRSECMPVVAADSTLVHVYFWDEVFGSNEKRNDASLKLPVVIMAGGKGSRLKPITNILPKPLIPLGEKTILEHILDRFVAVDCREFLMTVNYKAEMIRHYFETLSHEDYKIDYFHEKDFYGTAGSLSLLRDRINSTFFVSNCDILIDCDYAEIYDYHIEHKNEITIVGVMMHYNIPYGVMNTGEGGALLDISEKPEITFKINSGMYLLEPHLLNEIPEYKHFHITELIEQVRLRNGNVGVFPVNEGAWMDIGEWKEYNRTMQRMGFEGINTN